MKGVDATMSARRTWVLIGFAAGALGYLACNRAYRRARAACPPFEKPTYGKVQELLADMRTLWRNPAALVSLRSNARLDPGFVDKLMLAAAGELGQRDARSPAGRLAAQQGMNETLVRSLLEGQVEAATVEEAPAIFFAHHYAEQHGRPELDMLKRLTSAYDQRTASDIVTLLRVVTVASLAGNSLDALYSRLLGKPNPRTRLLDELAVAVLFVGVILPLMPILALRARLAASSAAQPARSERTLA